VQNLRCNRNPYLLQILVEASDPAATGQRVAWSLTLSAYHRLTKHMSRFVNVRSWRRRKIVF